MNRTWEWHHQQTERRIRQWQRLYWNVFDIPSRNPWPSRAEEPFEEHWTNKKRGIFRKFTQSCDCLHCQIARHHKKYRNYRHEIKAHCERWGLAGIKTRGRFDW